MIPKLFHEIWIGDKPKPKHYSVKWTKVMPEYKLMYWDNKRIRPYAERLYNIVGKRHLTLIQATDIMRLMIINDLGGVYLDHDYEIISDFDHIIQPSEANIAWRRSGWKPWRLKPGLTLRETWESNWKIDQHEVPDGIHGGLADTCFVAAIPGSKYVTEVLDLFLADVVRDQPQYIFWDVVSGASVLTDVLYRWKIPLDTTKPYHSKRLSVHSAEIFCPDCQTPIHGTSVAFHHCYSKGNRPASYMGEYQYSLKHSTRAFYSGFATWCEKYL